MFHKTIILFYLSTKTRDKVLSAMHTQLIGYMYLLCIYMTIVRKNSIVKAGLVKFFNIFQMQALNG